MRQTDERGRLRVINRDECESRLADVEIGRLALDTGGAPEVFPVNFAYVDGEIVFRTDEGLKLDLLERAAVTFEVDGIDVERREGWSVVAHGAATEVTAFDKPGLQDRIRALALYPWAEGDKGHWVRIVPTQITGREIVHG